nr:DNA-directed DNA polymerase [Tanacetum cinerariifolium]
MLVRGDIYDDLSLLRFYQNDNVLPWVNIKQKEGEDGPEWVVRSEFEDALANFMHKKKFHTKRIGEMLDQHPPTQSTPANHTEGVIEKEGPKGAESNLIQDEEVPRKWTEAEYKEDSNQVQAVSFYLRTDSVEPLEWKALANRLKPLSIKPPELELKELPENLEYAFLQENNKLSVFISSALSAVKKSSLLEVLKNHKGVIAWSIADIKGIYSSFCTYKILISLCLAVFTKQDVKPRLLGGSYYFKNYIEIRDKKCAKNLTADHLPRLENLNLGKLTKAEIRDLFTEKRLMAASDKNNEPCKDMKNGAIELYDEDGNEFIINKQQVKLYQKDVLETDKNDDITLMDDEGEVT